MFASVEQEILSYLKRLDWCNILDSKNLSVTEVRSHSDQIQVDLVLHEHLRKFLPTLIDETFISEESPPRKSTPRNYWLVDPLDGTNEFRRGLPEYAVSIAFIENYLPKIGVIFNPATGEQFASDGTFLMNRTEIRTNSKKPTYLLSRSEYSQQLHCKNYSIAADHLAIGGTAYKLGIVAATSLDLGYVTYQPKSLWDIGAGFAILQRLFDVRPETLDGDSIEFYKYNLRVPTVVVKPREFR